MQFVKSLVWNNECRDGGEREECFLEFPLTSCPGSGAPAGLWGRHPAPGAQLWPGEPVQLGCGPLLHWLLPASLRLLQGYSYSLWQQVGPHNTGMLLYITSIMTAFFICWCCKLQIPHGGTNKGLSYLILWQISIVLVLHFHISWQVMWLAS